MLNLKLLKLMILRKNPKNNMFYSDNKNPEIIEKRLHQSRSKVSATPGKIEVSGKAKFISNNIKAPVTIKRQKNPNKIQEIIRKPAVPKQNLSQQQNSKHRTSVETAVDPVQLQLLSSDTEKVLNQLQDMTKQIELNLLTFRRRRNPSKLSINGSNERLKSKSEVMQDRARKMRNLK
jgi:hypothetical protein